MSRPEPIECIVLRTNESESKKNGLIRTVTLMVPNDGAHPFQGLVGERLHIIALNVQDDETTKPADLSGASPEAPAGQGEGATRPVPSSPELKERRKWDEISPTEQAGIRCGEPEFKAFIETEFPTSVRENGFVGAVRNYCGVESRRELNVNPEAAAKWRGLESIFQNRKWLRNRGYAA
jgi:hypothetical protein